MDAEFCGTPPDAAKRGAIALSAARGGSRDACRYLFVRFGEDLYVELVSRMVPAELAESRVMALFAGIPYQRDADFDAWLDRRAEPARPLNNAA